MTGARGGLSYNGLGQRFYYDGNVVIGAISSVVKDTRASKEEMSVPDIIRNEAISGIESGIFAGIGMGENYWIILII